MKHLPWIALVLMATPAFADSKIPIGFYRISTITGDGQTVDLANELKKSVKSQGTKYEADLVRMTVELEANKLTIGIDQVIGERGSGSASHCRVRTSVGITPANGKFTIPGIEASADAGEVRVKSSSSSDKDTTTTKSDSNKRTSSCNVSLDAGTFTIKSSGKRLELIGTDEHGKPFSINLVPDRKDLDLQARALAFAGRK